MMRVDRSISDVYRVTHDSQKERYDRICKVYNELYDSNVHHVIRIPYFLSVPYDHMSTKIHKTMLCSIEQDILVVCGYENEEGKKDRITINNSMKSVYGTVVIHKDTQYTYEDNSKYKNMLVCAYKTLLSLEETNMFGMNLYIDTMTPAIDGTMVDVSTILGVVLGCLVREGEIGADSDTHMYCHDLQKVVDRVVHKFDTIKDDNSYVHSDVMLHLNACIGMNEGCMFMLDSHSNSYVNKQFDDRFSLMLCPVVGGLSKTKDNIRKARMLLEYRLFLHSIGIHEYAKYHKVEDVLLFKNCSLEDLKQMVTDNYENKAYTVKDIEEGLEISLGSLLDDVPFSNNILSGIFSLNVYNTCMMILEVYGDNQAMVDSNIDTDVLDSVNRIYKTYKAYMNENSKIETYLSTAVPHKCMMYLKTHLMIVVEDRECAGLQEILKYYNDHSEDIVLFDDIERLCVGSKLSSGVSIVLYKYIP